MAIATLPYLLSVDSKMASEDGTTLSNFYNINHYWIAGPAGSPRKQLQVSSQPFSFQKRLAMQISKCGVQRSLRTCKNHLLALTSPLLELLFGVLSFILLATFDRFQLFILDLSGLLHNLRYVAVALDTSDLGPVMIIIISNRS